MKKANMDKIRETYVGIVKSWFENYMEQDCGMIASGTFNFPIVADDGEEGWVEVVIKVPKGTKDEEYDGYGRREDYAIKLQERAEKARKSAEAKAKKIARDKARREKEDKQSSFFL